MQVRELGKTGVKPSCVGMGGVTLGEIYAPVPDQVSRNTLEVAWDSGIRYFDTSPWYGHGLSELRFGEVLRSKPRNDYVLSTKIGRTFFRPQKPDVYRPTFWKGGLSFDFRFDYTYDGIMRSYEHSMLRLGVNTIDLLLIHDLDIAEIGSQDLVDAHFIDLEKSGWRALEMLRSYGEIKGIGAGVNILGTIPDMLRRFELDFFLVAMPYTLLDQEVLNEEFPACAERDMGIVIGSPFASGILATGSSVETPYYNYEPAAADIIDKVRRIETVCQEYSVSLKAAAFQFPLLHPSVASIVSGAGSPEQARENAALLDAVIPDVFWKRLRDLSLIHPDSLPAMVPA